ncbi:MAG: TetR family transcriptional regulator [Halioglobus sp.]|nr:TetR family transcriptional regulator [Halioglobus sp.]
MPSSTSAPAERRRQQRAVATRNALLDTATAAFSQVGYDGISVRQLEERSGVKRGLVAYHFGDKEQLWRDAVDRLFQALAEEFLDRVAALADVAPLEAARGVVRAFVRYSAAHPALNRLMMQESVVASWRVDYIVDAHIRPLLDALAATMPEAADLVWGQSDPHRYYLLSGASAFVFTAEQECLRLFDCSPRDADFVERHAEMVVGLLLPPTAE